MRSTTSSTSSRRTWNRAPGAVNGIADRQSGVIGLPAQPAPVRAQLRGLPGVHPVPGRSRLPILGNEELTVGGLILAVTGLILIFAVHQRHGDLVAGPAPLEARVPDPRAARGTYKLNYDLHDVVGHRRAVAAADVGRAGDLARVSRRLGADPAGGHPERTLALALGRRGDRPGLHRARHWSACACAPRGDVPDGPGRLLVALYGLFALAAGGRATVQLAREVTLPYVLSAVAAAIYLVAAVALARGAHRVARAACGIELVGVLSVGALARSMPDETVWSGFGAGLRLRAARAAGARARLAVDPDAPRVVRQVEDRRRGRRPRTAPAAARLAPGLEDASVRERRSAAAGKPRGRARARGPTVFQRMSVISASAGTAARWKAR